MLNILPISLTDIALSDEISAPLKERKAQGRPQIQRHTGGEQRKIGRAQAQLNNSDQAPVQGQGSQSCSHCGEYGHNKLTCTEDAIV